MRCELYYKDLISEDASLEKLVDDLMLLVQGANELAEAAGAKLGPAEQEESARTWRACAIAARESKSRPSPAPSRGQAVPPVPLFAAGFALPSD